MFQWIQSIRSIATLMIAGTFCYLSIIGKIESKDVMLAVILVLNFYFLVKERKEVL
jgi:hypothetical protein